MGRQSEMRECRTYLGKLDVPSLRGWGPIDTEGICKGLGTTEIVAIFRRIRIIRGVHLYSQTVFHVLTETTFFLFLPLLVHILTNSHMHTL